MRIQTFVGIGMILLLTACGASPQATVREFYQNVEKGEISKASSLLSSLPHQMLGGQILNMTLTLGREKIKLLGGIKNIKVEGNPSKDAALLIVEVTYGNGMISYEKMNLVLEEGRWKIAQTKF